MSSILDDSYDLNQQHNQAAYNNLLHLVPSDQELLWSAQPVQGLLWNRGDGIFGCFGLFLLGLGLPFLTFLLSGAAPWWVLCFVLPFLLIGFYFSGGHLFYNQWERAHAFYGLTSTALWIKEGKKSKSIPLSYPGHWQKYEQKNRHTWVWRSEKEAHSKILAVLGDLPPNSTLEQQLLRLDQEIFIKKKKTYYGN